MVLTLTTLNSEPCQRGVCAKHYGLNLLSAIETCAVQGLCQVLGSQTGPIKTLPELPFWGGACPQTNSNTPHGAGPRDGKK